MKRAFEEISAVKVDEQNKTVDAINPPNRECLVHFIWAGGSIDMPKKNIKTLALWATANPAFNTIIWVDAWDVNSKQVDQTRLDQIQAYYQEEFKSSGIEVFLNDPPPNYQRKQASPIIIRDITQYGVCNDYIRYEIDKVIPNYGSSSDLLRYNILLRFGGAYFDSDVAPGADPLMKCPFFSSPQTSHVLYLDHVSQKVEPPPVCFEVFELFHPIALDERLIKTYQPIPGNDSFICSQANPLMAEIIRLTEDNYQLPKRNDMQEFIIAAYGGINWRDQTLHRTGTTPVQVALSNANPRNESGERYRMTCAQQTVTVHPLRHTGMMLCQPLKNQRNWILEIDLSDRDTKLIISQLVTQSEQELRFFGIMRLDDHIQLLRQLAKAKMIDPEPVIVDFIKQLEGKNLNLKEVKVAQLVSRDPHVHSFYTKHNLFDCTQLLKGTHPQSFKQVCELATSKALLDKLAENLKEHGPLVIKDMKYTEGEILMMYQVLNAAVDFIELLQSDPNKYERMPSYDCTSCLEHVLAIERPFEDKFSDAELTFDTDRVERLLENFKHHARENDRADAEDFMKLLMGATPDDQKEDPDQHKIGKGFK